MPKPGVLRREANFENSMVNLRSSCRPHVGKCLGSETSDAVLVITQTVQEA